VRRPATTPSPWPAPAPRSSPWTLRRPDRRAREACEREDVKVELHHAPLAELAFVRADTIDACISVYGLATVEDVDRVFRQVHRVLRPELPLVVSLPHPAFAMVDPTEADLRIRRSYWESAAVTAVGDEWAPRADVPRTIAQLFTSLHRANFRIDTVLEPEPAGTGPGRRSGSTPWPRSPPPSSSGPASKASELLRVPGVVGPGGLLLLRPLRRPGCHPPRCSA
jgi:hypothetical protein